jgi:hypothetical protein
MIGNEEKVAARIPTSKIIADGPGFTALDRLVNILERQVAILTTVTFKHVDKIPGKGRMFMRSPALLDLEKDSANKRMPKNKHKNFFIWNSFKETFALPRGPHFTIEPLACTPCTTGCQPVEV